MAQSTSVKIDRLYILPTSHGLAVLALNVIFVLVGAASGNNSVYIMAFVMFGVYLLAMVATTVNLKALEVELVDAGDGFAGEAAKITFAIHNPSSKARFMLKAIFRPAKLSLPTLQEEIITKGRTLISVSLVKDTRGVYILPPVQLSSVYPLGLFRTWVNVHLPVNFYVYPKRIGSIELGMSDAGTGGGDFRGGNTDTRHEDFREHKRYETGESHHHVDWKAFARGGEMLTKRYETSAPRHFILDWKRVAHLGTEAGLSQMAKWIEDLRKQDISFEVRLPGIHVVPGSGWGHGQDALRELAKFRGEAA